MGFPAQIGMRSMKGKTWETDDQIRHMISVNHEQKAYYETNSTEEIARGLPTRLWAKLRQRQQAFRKIVGIQSQIDRLHAKWIVSAKPDTVLDLGCHSGNPHSLNLARLSKTYLGVDLSRTATDILRAKIEKESIQGARVVAMDFLDPNLPGREFDFVYARSVLHHFEYLEAALARLSSLMVPGARMVTYDPLQTSGLFRTLRKLYRPFQADAPWEFPFEMPALRMIEKYFQVVEMRGVLGKAKWAIPLGLVSTRLATKIGNRWHAEEFRPRDRFEEITGCMHITMLLQKPRGARQKTAGSPARE